MTNKDKKELKLIYVHKVGIRTKGRGLYEFVFSKNPSNIDAVEFGWTESPASGNAKPPTEDYYDKVFKLETDKFDLFCLHDADDREYMHGYHNIHALAYEQEREDDELYDDDYNENDDDEPLLVFHYNMSYEAVEELLYQRGDIEPLEEVV